MTTAAPRPLAPPTSPKPPPGTSGRRHKTTGERVSLWGLYAVLLSAAVITLIPFAWLVSAALKTKEGFFAGVFLPLREGGGIAWDQLTLDHFVSLFGSIGLGRSLLNSVFLSSSTALLATLFAAMGGYALAMYRFRGRGLVLTLVLGAVLIPGPLLLAPGYQLLFELGLLDTMAGLILPAAAPAFGVFLFRQAVVSSVPSTLVEAARMDGCGEARIFFQVALPLLQPMIGAFMLITFVGTWNNFIGPQVVLQSAEKFPLAVTVANLRGTYQQDYGLQMAGTLVSVLPVVLLFMLMQREFVSGLTSGAVKG
jgi:multiple sugar transport system permease protein